MATTHGATRSPTRGRLLDAGFRMWVDEPPVVLFGGFTVSRVARAAGVTRATFYSYWPSTEAYLADLVDHLATYTSVGYDKAVAAAAGQVGNAGSDVVSQLLAACDREFAIILEDPALRVRMAFLSQMDDPDVAAQLRARYRDAEALKVTNYTAVIDGWGREPRPPLDQERLQAVFAMLGDAMVARHVIDPEVMPAELYGQVVLAMLMMLTRRIDDTRDLPRLVDQINTWPALGLRLRGQQKADRASLTAPALDATTARSVVQTARLLLATMGWQELSLGEIASVVALSDEVLLRAFGSKSGLAMAIFNLNVCECLASLHRTDDPITDLRAMLAIGAEQLRRFPALTQSVALLLAGVAAMPMPDLVDDIDPIGAIVEQVGAAQEAGQLRADLDPRAFTTSLLRVMVADNAPPAPSSGVTVAELVLIGAGAPPPPEVG
jgi:AcrR family transcriptional regulator